jgi:MSHA biogenesis protein MshO
MAAIKQDQSGISGFTLIELIMVIVLIGALSSVASVFIAGPVSGFLDTNRRAELVDIAETALQRMTREIHDALPNSVRISNNGTQFAVEYLSTLTGGRYRDLQDTGTSATDFNAYNGDNIAAITAVSNISMTFDNSGTPGWRFPARSPSNRFFVVDTPVSFVCDSSTGEVLMYQNYSIMASQPVAAGDFGVAGAVLADKVSDCGASTFLYNAGAGVRYGLVVIRLTVSDAGEDVSLLQQAHVLNAP